MALALLLSYSSYCSANQTAVPNPQRVTSPGNNVTIGDDQYGTVELEFLFPFYGEDFDTAYMYDNGVLGFQNPSDVATGGLGYFCCNPTDVQDQASNGNPDLGVYSYAIYALWTDLIDIGATGSGYFEEGDTSSHTFYWKNLAEYGQNLNLNTFDVTINSDGSYTINYDTIKITNHGVAAGSAGDLSNAHNETYDASVHGIEHYFYAQGYNSAITGIWGSVNNYQLFCATNALYDPTCPGYAQALAEQQYNQACQANPLYDPGCPGYATAYYNQQCTANPLYDAGCPGYTTANYNYQCTVDPTSDPGCPDYYVAMCEEDPLYDMGCIGYDTAYFDQQCSLDPQYDQMCVGYVDLSGNDDVFTVLDPVVDDVVSVELPEIQLYEAPTIEVEPMFEPEVVELDEGFATMDDSIEEEIAELENMGGEEVMDEDIEAEIAQLEVETQEEETSESNGPDMITGNTNMEDDIEEELQALEEDSDSRDEESLAPEDIQVADSDDELGAQPAPGRSKPKPKVDPAESKRQKIKLLVALKAAQAVKELEQAVSLEQQAFIQRRLLALISFVPNFNEYAEKEQINQVNFYPPKPTIDHAYARWFLNDPKFGEMEDLQYRSD